jgi:hypothetical protein
MSIRYSPSAPSTTHWQALHLRVQAYQKTNSTMNSRRQVWDRDKETFLRRGKRYNGNQTASGISRDKQGELLFKWVRHTEGGAGEKSVPAQHNL